MYNSDSTPTTGKIFIGITISLLIIILSRIGVFNDVYSVSSGIFNDFQQQNMNFFKNVEQDINFLSNLGNLRDENQKLKSENSNLKSDLDSANILLEDSKKILKQLSFNPEKKYIPVRITQYSDNQTEIVINKGSKEGVKLNDVLVIENYLIGIITEVNEGYSRGRLIISSSSKVPSQSMKGDLRGVSLGDGINSINFQQVPNTTKLQINDRVVTAGVDGTYPFGLTIGKIINIESKDTDIEQKAQLATEINLKNLREIFIIRNKWRIAIFF